MLSEGPKVFAFDALTCEALENFDLSVSTADYLQPFPSVVIELPSDYTRKRVVPFEEGSISSSSATSQRRRSSLSRGVIPTSPACRGSLRTAPDHCFPTFCVE